jgi:hypothetical protein
MMEVYKEIQHLFRRNKDEDYQRFKKAISHHTITILPEWHRLNSLLHQEGIKEGEVVVFGTMGDPLVRASEVKTNIMPNCALQFGQRVKFEVVTRSREIAFGQLVELTSDCL